MLLQAHHCRVVSRSEVRRGGGKKSVSNWFQNLYVRAIVRAVWFYGKSSTIILTGENLAQETHCSRKVVEHGIMTCKNNSMIIFKRYARTEASRIVYNCAAS